ncbi:MAG: thioredoxin family protein [Phycisphaerales bacterium JB043]
MADTTLQGTMMLDRELLQQKHESGATYPDYVAKGDEHQRQRWNEIYEQVSLTKSQRELIGGFTRTMRITVLSGLWCGDCVAQCPLLARIAEANPERLDVRFLDRDEHDDLAERVAINGGLRVPTFIFAAEDHVFCGLFGDKTLTRYRASAEKQLGASCPLPGAPVPTEELEATLRDLLDECERIHLMLRLSPRLREKHAD